MSPDIYTVRDGEFAGPVRWIAAHWKAPAYLYRFDYVAEALRGRGPDAAHASEIPFAFKTAGVFARGDVRHSDHATITLPFWHRVMMNTETQSRTMRNVAFLD